jgi:hypothetical protein
MAFDLTDCQFSGPALPEPFVKFELEKELGRLALLNKTTGDEGKKLKDDWAAYRRKLYALSTSGGPLRVRNHVIEPLLPLLGYENIEDGGEVQTRETLESGGTLLLSADRSAQLRVWSTAFDEDLYAPSQRGHAWRFSHTRVAQRVLLATGERVGLLTNGIHLLILISDPARPDSTITIPVEGGWKRSREIPDSFRLVLALSSPNGIAALPEIVEKARLQQARVTKELRVQARQAVERFIQEVLDNPANSLWFASHPDRDALAKQLWHEGLFIVYRLLFIFKLESTDDPARSFSFASTSLWRNTFSPSTALAVFARKVLDTGANTGTMLEHGIRSLFRMFEDGIECTELVVKPLGGALFGQGATPNLSQLTWGERAVALLFDKLLWTAPKRGSTSRERVHYGPLDVEDLGRVYEALLELEPGISIERMCRLRRSKLEVVVPFAQGEKYKAGGDKAEDGRRKTDVPKRKAFLNEYKDTKLSGLASLATSNGDHRTGLQSEQMLSAGGTLYSDGSDEARRGSDCIEYSGRSRPDGIAGILPLSEHRSRQPDGTGDPDSNSTSPLLSDDRTNWTDTTVDINPVDDDESADEEIEDELNPSASRRTSTVVEWIEEIPPNRFYLRVGLGRKATGSFYTPHSFVRFLIQETLGPQADERSPRDNPDPLALLKLKVLDPAMGSGHFLVEACRYLGDKLYEACRLCDDIASTLEHKADAAKSDVEKQKLIEQALVMRQRVVDLPDPDDELVRYLPSRSAEGEASGFSQKRAEALCRRLIATHCLYGVDKNPLAVELAKLALWLESHAEGMPLTFMDHRLVAGDSLSGPFWDKLIFRPGKPSEPIENLFHQGLNLKLSETLRKAVRKVQELDATLGASVADIQHKVSVKAELDRALTPFRIAAAAWSGGVMLGPNACDDTAYGQLLQTIANTGELPEMIENVKLRMMIARGLGVGEIPAKREAICAVIEGGKCVPALAYDLAFPEVFYPSGQPWGREGFDAVVGNPPWDTIRKNEDQFFGGHDFTFLDPPTKREKKAIKERLLSIGTIKSSFESLVENLLSRDRVNDVLFETHKAQVNGQLAGRGTYDDYMLFAELSTKILRKNGSIGMVFPSAFHANEGATGVRKLYLEKTALKSCYSFENRRKLFEIDSRFKFALVIAQAGRVSESVSCAFYLHDDEWLFGDRTQRPPLPYSIEFIKKTGGEYLSFLELRTNDDLVVAEKCFSKGESFGDVCERLQIKLSQELNMTYDAHRFTPTVDILPNGEDPRDPEVAKRLWNMGYLVLHEGKTFWHFDDHWGERPRYLVGISQLVEQKDILVCSTYFRLAYRAIASSTNERTAIFSLLPPLTTCGHSASIEKDPEKRRSLNVLYIIAISNSFCFDACLRLSVAANVTKYLLNLTPIIITQIQSFLSHSALRLTCNHAGYAPLWTEQLGPTTWREPSGRPPLSWPVLQSADERWEVRSAIDAVVAEAYGLTRDQYEHVLSTFSHSSYKNAPVLCLAKFDELKTLGLDAFTRKYDPYHDIPLNESLPKPVIELPGVVTAEDGGRVAEEGASNNLVLSNDDPGLKKKRKKS